MTEECSSVFLTFQEVREIMKIRVLDRILVALAGLLLVAACAGVVAQVFFSVDVTGFAAKLLAAGSTKRKIIIAAAVAVVLILGLYCLLMLFRHRKRKDKFVLQKLESGDLAISLKTVESMVEKCVAQHPEIKTEGIRLENQREGLLIRIRGTVAGGISIPLTVDTLQKQVKRYVTACSGVEVKGIRIQIESSGEDAKDALFAIDPPGGNLLPKGSEPGREAAPAQPAPAADPEVPAEKESAPPAEAEKPEPREQDAAAAAMAAAASLMNEVEIDDDRPIHQQLFSVQEEPCIMPLPPEGAGGNPEESAGSVTEAEAVPEKKKKEIPETAETPEIPETADNPFTDETKGEENA